MLEKNNPKPLYQQLREILIDSIESGKWSPNERIPSENELAATYGVSRMTARSVLTDLVREGLLYRVQGKGTFVAEKIVTSGLSYIGIREQLEQMGYEVKTRIIESGLEKCSNTVSRNLKIESGMPVFKIIRVRYIKDEPISLHLSYIKSKYSDKLTDEALEKDQLCVLLNHFYGLQRKKVNETLESVLATSEEAHLLKVDTGHPLLLLKDLLYDEYDVPYEYTKVIFRGDKIKIQLHYQ